MGVYSKFKAAKASGGSFNYLLEGRHQLRLESAKIDKTRKGIEFFAMEFTMLETTSDAPAMAVGSRVHYMTAADKDPYAGNVKQAAGATFDVTEDQIDAMEEDEFEELMEAFVGAVQGGTGRIIDADCVERVSQAGNKYVATRFAAAPEEFQPSVEDAG
jgi:hypothetical protein